MHGAKESVASWLSRHGEIQRLNQTCRMRSGGGDARRPSGVIEADWLLSHPLIKTPLASPATNPFGILWQALLDIGG